MTTSTVCPFPTEWKREALHHLSAHARRRMRERGVSEEALALALLFGRIVWTRGAQVFAIGRREVRYFLKQGVDLTLHEGVQVVCAPDGSILTVYRNRDFRGLRPALGRKRAPHRFTRTERPMELD
jgi:hypothetical protein